MASNSKNGLIDIQQLCGICLQSFRHPKLLSCLHTFCLYCLKICVTNNEFNKAIVCPICDHKTIMPDGGLKELKNNPVVGSKPVSRCMDCMRAPPDSECQECRVDLCTNCVTTHRYNYPLHRFRSSTTSEQIPLQCSKHSRQCREFCQICDELLCDKCHLAHVSHIVFGLEECCVDAANDIREATEKCGQQIECLQKTTRDIERVAGQIQKEKETKLGRINDKFAALHRQLDAYKESLTLRLEENFCEKLKYLQVEKHSMYIGESLIKHSCDFAEKMVTKPNQGSEILAYKRDIMERLCKLYLATSFLPRFEARKFNNCLPELEVEELGDLEACLGRLTIADRSNQLGPKSPAERAADSRGGLPNYAQKVDGTVQNIRTNSLDVTSDRDYYDCLEGASSTRYMYVEDGFNGRKSRGPNSSIVKQTDIGNGDDGAAGDKDNEILERIMTNPGTLRPG